MPRLAMATTSLLTVLILQNYDYASAARLSLKSSDINSLYHTALAVARSNPRIAGLRFFVGYTCDPDHPFNCLFSTCQSNGLCGCNANETTFLQMLCLPQRRLGQSCIDNQQCRKMTRNSKCLVPHSLTVGTCTCNDGSLGQNFTCNRAVSVTSLDKFDKEENDNGLSDAFSQKSKSCSANQHCLRFGKNSECNLFMQQCECKTGYRMDDQDRLCRDINECKELPSMDTCRGTTDKDVECVNTDGSFDCYCRSNKGRGSGRIPSGICCSDNQIPCDKEPKCVDIQSVCDGFPDCTNGYDEMFDYCVKPKFRSIDVNNNAAGNDTSLPGRSLSSSTGSGSGPVAKSENGPVDPLPYTQF